MGDRLAVLDASVGVKWLKNERGSDEARALLERHRSGELRIIVPVLFAHEVVGVAVRHDPSKARAVWGLLRDANLASVGLDSALVDAALEHVQLLGCTFYDALAPALASLLGGTLYSADARAHARFPGVVILG